MKYLKYLLGIVALLGLFFIARGFFTPSISYDSEIIVDKPVGEAWAVMNDESKLSQWLTGMTDMEHIGGEKNTVGAVTKYTYDEDGQVSTIIETIKSIRPNEHVAMNFVIEDVMDMDYKVDFNEKDGKTSIKSSTTAKGIGMFMRSMVSFMQGAMQVQEDENMAKLKKLIDNNTTNYFPTLVVDSVESE